MSVKNLAFLCVQKEFCFTQNKLTRYSEKRIGDIWFNLLMKEEILCKRTV